MTKTLQEKLRVDPKLPEEAIVNVCAKHLRELDLAEELEIESSVPDWRPVRVSAGKMRKALDPSKKPAKPSKPAKTAAEKKADADAKKTAAAKKKAGAKKAAEDKKKAEAEANDGDKSTNDSE